MENQHQDILSSIEDFKKIFGDEYKFLPVATEEELSYFENKFNVKIPYEYRWFLLNVANGIVNEDRWDFNLVKPNDFRNLFYKEDEYNPAIPFKWDKKIMCYKYDSDAYPFEFIVNDDLECFTECTNGQINCGDSHFIVVKGKEYGNVWVDNFASMQEVYPDYDLKRNKKRLNFIEWLIKRIENKIEFFTPVIAIDKMEKNIIDLNFSRNDEEWYLEMKFEKLKEFNEEWTDGNISIWIAQDDFDKPQVFQKNAINYFNDYQEKVLNALCIGVIEYYPKLMKIYEVEEFDKQNGFPQLNNINDVKNIISIQSIDVLEEEKDDFGYLGFECCCPWDEEHGLRITMHKDRVVSVDADSSYYAYEEILKDKFTEEEWENYIESREKQKEESLAKYYEEKALLEKENQEKEENITELHKKQEKVLKKELEGKIFQKESSFHENIETPNKKEIKISKKWWQFWK